MTLFRLPLLLLAFAALAPGQVEFFHVTDTHVLDATGLHPSIVEQRKHLEQSTANLQSLIRSLNDAGPAFVLITGDLIDGISFPDAGGGTRTGQIEHFTRIVDASPVPVYLVLGNHDVQRYKADPGASKPAGSDAAAAEDRAAWRAAAPCFRDGTYYAFQQKAGATTYRFLVLDNSSVKDRVYAEAQYRWLETQIRQAGDDPIVVALHIPLDNSAASAPIRNLLARAANPALVLCGHRHSDAIEELSLGDHSVTQVRTAIFGTDSTHVRAIRLFEDHVEIGATGRRGSTLHTVALKLVPVH